MKHFFPMRVGVLIIAFCLLSVSMRAGEDFIALLLSEIHEEGNAGSSQEDFRCITVGPNMMEKVLDMMSKNADTANKQIRKVLPHIKSLRIFTALQNRGFYAETANGLLTKNKSRYKHYSSNNRSKIWLRKNRDAVIELIILSTGDDGFKILNLTGEMSAEFVSELLRM